jgi:hypothetical protein
VAEAGVGIEGPDGDFLDGVLGRSVSECAEEGEVGRAVEQNLANLVGCTADGPGVPGVVVERMNDLRGSGGDDAGGELGKGCRCAAVQRQVGDGLGGDHLAYGCVGLIDERRGVGNSDSLGGFADLKGQIDDGVILRLQRDSLLLDLLEARGGGRDGVGAGKQEGHDILSGGV